MAQKILYKTTAYHCPRCGGITEPTKKYCEFCERDLKLLSENHNDYKMRLLVDCGEYIYFDNLIKFDMSEQIESIDATCLEDTSRTTLYSKAMGRDIFITLPRSRRTSELLSLPYMGIRKIRFEHLGVDLGFECESYVSNVTTHIKSDEWSLTEIKFTTISAPEVGKAIPQEILTELRCPNCGAPIKSRYGACDYCSGWTEVEW